MVDLVTLARPYAEAVFKRAKETNSSQSWSDQMTYLSVVMQDKDLISLVGNPKVERNRIIQLILEVCSDHLDAEGANLVKLLVQNDRLLLAPQIASLFESYKADDEGYVDVDVTSAFELTKTEEKNIEKVLQTKLNKSVRIKVAVDKQLIGGFLARAGDIVIDGSIKGRLQQLAKRL